MQKKNVPQILTYLLFLLFLFVNLTILWRPEVWLGLGDPADYLHQSKMSLGSKEFYFPEKAPGFYPRAFTVPLFYKIAGANADIIVQVQKFVHTLSAMLLICALLPFIRKKVLKYLTIFFIYIFMSWWNIFGWTIVLLSESLSMSLLFIWIATFLFYIKQKKPAIFALHILITILFIFFLYSWPYVLLLFYLLVSLYFFNVREKIYKRMVSLFVLTMAIFFIQQKSANIGQRYRLPILNNIIVKIVPNEEYSSWFVNQGMPCMDSLQAEYSGITWKDKRIYEIYNDSSYIELFDWINEKGKSVYTKFLITHPGHSLLFKEDKESLERIFAYNLNYPGPIKSYSHFAHHIFPLFNLVMLLCLIALLVILLIRRRDRFLYAFPVILFIIFFFNAIMLYNADALEVDRHLFITNIMIQLIGFLSTVILLDNMDYLIIKKRLSLLMKKLKQGRP